MQTMHGESLGRAKLPGGNSTSGRAPANGIKQAVAQIQGMKPQADVAKTDSKVK
jgi:hypothetical protein